MYTVSPDNLFVFYDKYPAVTGNAKIKGIYGQWGDGLYLEHCTKNGYTDDITLYAKWTENK